jgi:hypothetical protein
VLAQHQLQPLGARHRFVPAQPALCPLNAHTSCRQNE